jgi:hypothetical protein
MILYYTSSIQRKISGSSSAVSPAAQAGRKEVENHIRLLSN